MLATRQPKDQNETIFIYRKQCISVNQYLSHNFGYKKYNKMISREINFVVTQSF